MASRGYQFDLDSVKKIKADHETLKRRLHHLEQMIRGGLSTDSREQKILVKTTEDIDAMNSSDRLGTGRAKIYSFKRDEYQDKIQDGDDYVYFYNYELEETQREEIRIYNPNKIPIGEDTFVKCERHSSTGLWLVEELQTAIGIASNGISARGTTTAGSGQVDLYYIKNGALTFSGVGLVAYNIAEAAVAGGAYVTIKRNSTDGLWYVDMAECD